MHNNKQQIHKIPNQKVKQSTIHTTIQKTHQKPNYHTSKLHTSKCKYVYTHIIKNKIKNSTFTVKNTPFQYKMEKGMQNQ